MSVIGNKKYLNFSFVIGHLTLILVMTANAITFQSSIDKKTVPVNETVNYTITLVGENVNLAPRPSPPILENLSVVSRAESTNISIINGQASTSVSYIYTLKPVQTGNAAIQPSKVEIEGETYQTEPIKIAVTKASSRLSSRSKAIMASSPYNPFGYVESANPVIVETSVSDHSPYVNQMVILTFSFYYRVNLFQAPVYSLPATTGFWSINLPPSNQVREVRVKGIRYLLQEFKTALFPTSPGKITLGAATLRAQVDPFSAPTTFKTKPIILNVLPLPEAGKPAGFSGAVGKFSLTAQITPAQIEKGRPFTLTSKIFGDGNIQSISEPVFELSSNLKKLSSTPDEKVAKGISSVSGNKTFKFIIMPIKEGEGKVSRLRFSYFDSQEKTYREISAPDYQINVLASNIALPKELTDEKPKGTAGTVSINFDWKKPVKRSLAIINNKLFLLLAGLVAAAGLIWLGRQKYLEYQLADPVRLKRQQALKIARRSLRKARSLMASGKLKDFTAEIFEAVSRYLGDKYNFSAVGVTTDQLKDILSGKGIEAPLQESLDAFTNECDLIRFTPEKLKPESALELYKKAEELIINFQSSTRKNVISA